MNRPTSNLRTVLTLLGMLLLCFTLATRLDGWFQHWEGSRRHGGSALQLLLGESRRLFANHFFVKADIYFHSGYYPSIFDDRTSYHTPHMALYPEVVDLEKRNREAASKRSLFFRNEVIVDDPDGSPGHSRDWIDAFGRNFYPVRHTHLDEVGKPGEMRELLPWLRLVVELDPHHIETYVVVSYWLRRELGRIAEAEDFLRQGLRANPDSSELLFELGRIQRQHHHNIERARHLWERAHRKWDGVESGKDEPNFFILSQVLSNLARLEEEDGNWVRAARHLQVLRQISPSPAAVQRWLEDVWSRIPEPVHAIPAETE
jgi:tetratricopeptide (TPR) repeat protein